MDDAPWTLARLEAAINELPIEQLMARYRQCVEGGHVWRPLDASAIGIRNAEWCGWCLKMKTTVLEGWFIAGSRQQDETPPRPPTLES
jgi:hypothetical protein